METKEPQIGMQTTQTLSSRSLLVIAPVIGLLYGAIVLLFIVVSFISSSGGLGISAGFVPFIPAFIASAVGVWRRSRPGYLGAILSSTIFLILLAPRLPEAFADVAYTRRFVDVITGVPTLVATIAYSILGLRVVWRKNALMARSRTIPRSGSIGLLALGFILGGLVIGLLAGGVQTGLLNSLGQVGSANVSIPLGAANPSNPEFYRPETYQAKVGDTVTWLNVDSAAHTVTSTGGAFDSGNMNAAARWSYTFNQAGTFEYFCVYHPWMKGSVVVTG